MKAVIPALAAALVSASAASAQNLVEIPPHERVYNGFTRGFWFQAQTSFTIVLLDLPMDAFQAGDTASYLVTINGVDVFHSTGTAGRIETEIQVREGDEVHINGNWSPAAPGSFTAHNSYTEMYSSSAPAQTTIEGIPHALHRSGVQWDVGDPAYASAGRIRNEGGTLGRIYAYIGTSGSTCYPDCDTNGVLDFFDFLCFQNAFLAGDPYADCDENGVLDFFDFLCFQNEFLAGCP